MWILYFNEIFQTHTWCTLPPAKRSTPGDAGPSWSAPTLAINIPFYFCCLSVHTFYQLTRSRMSRYKHMTNKQTCPLLKVIVKKYLKVQDLPFEKHLIQGIHHFQTGMGHQGRELRDGVRLSREVIRNHLSHPPSNVQGQNPIWQSTGCPSGKTSWFVINLSTLKPFSKSVNITIKLILIFNPTSSYGTSGRAKSCTSFPVGIPRSCASSPARRFSTPSLSASSPARSSSSTSSTTKSTSPLNRWIAQSVT